jgi:hypothetical protein
MWRQGTGRFEWDANEGVPAPHIRRWSGDHPVIGLHGGKAKDLRRWASVGGSMGTENDSPHNALRTLVQWLSARPAIVNAVQTVSIEDPPEVDFPIGWWVSLELAAVSESEAQTVAPGLRRSYHATGLNSLQRILSMGMEPGFAINVDGGSFLQGVWSLAPQRSRLLTSYLLYSGLDSSGYLFAPVLELRSPEIDSHGRRTVLKRGTGGKKSRDQWLSYTDTTTVTKAWVHVLHIAELADSATEGFAIFAEGRLPPELELHPEASMASLIEQSQ